MNIIIHLSRYYIITVHIVIDDMNLRYIHYTLKIAEGTDVCGQI